MIDIKEMEKQILENEQNKDVGEHSIAYMLIKDARDNAKRWFIIAIAELIAIIAIVAGMIWYNSLPAEEYTVSVENDEGNANYVGNDMNGEIYNGEDNSQKNKKD